MMMSDVLSINVGKSVQVCFSFSDISLSLKMTKELFILIVIFGVSSTMNINEENVISTGKL